MLLVGDRWAKGGTDLGRQSLSLADYIYYRSLVSRFHLKGGADVHNPVYRVKQKHFASDKCSPQLVDKHVVPWRAVLLPVRSLIRRLRRFHRPSVDQTDPHGFECVRKHRTLRWSRHVVFSSEQQHNKPDQKGQKSQEIDGPVARVFLHKHRGHQAEGADVDAKVEYHIYTLKGDVGILHDPLSALEHFDLLFCFGHLLGDQGGDVGLDAAGSQTDHCHRGGQPTECGTVLDGEGEGCHEEDD